MNYSKENLNNLFQDETFLLEYNEYSKNNNNLLELKKFIVR